MNLISLVKHAPTAPGLRLFGIGPKLTPTNGLEKLQSLLNKNTFWARGRTKQQLGDDFTAAVELSNEEDIDAALLALDRIVDKGSDGYVTMAKIKKASILIAKGDRNEGLDIYLDLEKNAVDQSFRDIATILFVLNSLNNESKDDLLKK